MSLITRRSYQIEKQVLYNNVNTERLYGALIDSDTIPLIGGSRRIMAGSFLAAGERLLARAKVLSPVASGGTKLIVNNPWAFRVGDVIKLIGAAAATPTQELTAIDSGSAANVGTISAISSSSIAQITRIVPPTPAIGNTFTVTLNNAVTASFTATAATVANVTAGLKSALASAISNYSSLDWFVFNDNGTNLEITTTEPGEPFMVTATGTSAPTVTVTAAVGELTISTVTSALGIGDKVGLINQVPLGIIANEFVLTDESSLNFQQNFAAYNKAPIYSKALPYLDGHLVRAIPGLSYIPAY
jgi:hypothetical protein